MFIATTLAVTNSRCDTSSRIKYQLAATSVKWLLVYSSQTMSKGNYISVMKQKVGNRVISLLRSNHSGSLGWIIYILLYYYTTTTTSTTTTTTVVTTTTTTAKMHCYFVIICSTCAIHLLNDDDYDDEDDGPHVHDDHDDHHHHHEYHNHHDHLHHHIHHFIRYSSLYNITPYCGPLFHIKVT